MRVQEIEQLLKDTGISPEELAPRLSVSNMTIRRWLKEPRNMLIPPIYQLAFEQAVLSLLLENRLSAESPSYQWVQSEGNSKALHASLKGLGVNMETMTSGSSNPSGLIKALREIGSNKNSRRAVEEASKQFQIFSRMGKQWRRNIQILRNAISSKSLNPIDKLVAYGALFYLLAPFDLIPDHIPVIGLVDDFGILALASAYYMKRSANQSKVIINTET